MQQKRQPIVIQVINPNKTRLHNPKQTTIQLETTLLPFLKAAVALGVIHISEEALKNPVELAKNPDGSVKVSRSGRLVEKTNEEIKKYCKLLRDNLMNCTPDIDVNKSLQSLTAQINKSLAANNTNPELKQKIQWLFRPRNKKGDSLDELEYEKRPWFIYKGSYETGKHR